MKINKESKVFRVIFGEVSQSAFNFGDSSLIVIAKSYDEAAIKGLKFMSEKPKPRGISFLSEGVEENNEPQYKTKGVELISESVIY